MAFALASTGGAGIALAQAPAERAAAALEEQFRNPPAEARPRVWWHWMNGNVSKDGIAKDLAWMKRAGIGGAQLFDANLQTPQVVAKRLVYMTPEWKDAFRLAAAEADRLGLELAIASSPGWSETGGPWVPPQDGLKKLVWSETEVEGGRPFAGRLAAPPSITGPFQTIPARGRDFKVEKPKATHYSDIAVLAFPVAAAPAMATPTLSDRAGKTLDGAALNHADLMKTLDFPMEGADPPVLTVQYPTAQTIRSAGLFMPGSFLTFIGPLVAPRLEASDDGQGWRRVADFPASPVPSTVGFAPVTARHFRVVLDPLIPNIAQGAPAPGFDDSAAPDLRRRLGKRVFRIGDFRLSAEHRIDHGEAKAGFELVPDYFALSRGVPEVTGVAPGQVVDLTGKLRSDGTLDWTPPKGRWKVLRLGYSLLGTTNYPAPPEATGLEVDKFDGPAVRRYMEHYISMYRDASGGMVGQSGVDAILTDSIEVGAANWTPAMIGQFKRLRGYDPTPWLPALTGAIVGSRAQSDAFLYDFRRTLADLMASEHYGTVARVAHEHGLKVYGEALEGGRPSLGDDLAMRRYTDVPMAAMWTYARAEGPKPNYVADIKGAASVAHIYGQNLVGAESLTSSNNPWNYAPSVLKRVIDLEFALGVNRPVIHTSVHVPADDKLPGLSLGQFGQYFNRHETWAEMARPWMDYLARNSLMLQQGRNVADVAYFYGEEAPLTGLWGEQAITGAPAHYGYDFVNADAVMSALRNDGAELVTPGGARYRALFLGGSSRRMTLPTLRRIAALVEGGATVIGTAPEADPSLAGNPAEWSALRARLWRGAEMTRVGQGWVIAVNDLDTGLAAIALPPDFRFNGGGPDSDIAFVHRRLSDGDSYFLANRKDRAETIEARFRVTGKAPELWHADTGAIEPVSYRIENGATIVPLTLAPEQSLHVVFRRPAQAPALVYAKVE
ncbi:MAG: glycosyl hydrolase, partial [Novosphingobium sp.]